MRLRVGALALRYLRLLMIRNDGPIRGGLGPCSGITLGAITQTSGDIHPIRHRGGALPGRGENSVAVDAMCAEQIVC